MEIIITNVNGAQLGVECGVYYMKNANSEYFHEIPVITEDEALEYFFDNLN